MTSSTLSRSSRGFIILLVAVGLRVAAAGEPPVTSEGPAIEPKADIEHPTGGAAAMGEGQIAHIGIKTLEGTPFDQILARANAITTDIALPGPAAHALRIAVARDDFSTLAAVRPDVLQGHIMIGRAASPGDVPWQAGLIVASAPDSNRVVFCGGSLVVDRFHILTAAHCVKDESGEFSATDIDVLIGTTKFKDATQGQRIHVASIAVHPNFDINTFDHDLAVLTLAVRANAGTPIQLYTGPPVPIFALSQLQISGWGYTSNGGGVPGTLQIAEVYTVDTPTCAAKYGTAGTIYPDMVCAGSKLGADACQGDSGGPAAYYGDAAHSLPEPQLYAVVSAGLAGQCGSKTTPGIYAAVQPNLNFIGGVISMPVTQPVAQAGSRP